MDNKIMLQTFTWEMPNTGTLWEHLTKDVASLSKLGINYLWLPPCTKATQQNSTGYDIYDLYDLGEFDQKGTIRTRYGTKEQLIQMIEQCHHFDIKVMADVVLNHKAGADKTECFKVIEVSPDNRLKEISEPFDIEGWTYFNFPGRADTYSDFKWNFNYFTAVDRDHKTGKEGIYRILGDDKSFSNEVDSENNNFDYIMYADINLKHPDVYHELDRWAEWFIKTTHVDGFRMDAVKHMHRDFVKNFIENIRANHGDDFFTVGEYWSGDINRLEAFLKETTYEFSIFDVSLHMAFVSAGQKGNTYNLSQIFDHSLVKRAPYQSVTFVDNHDSEREGSVAAWFRPHAYALIMLRQDGYPCLFLRDYEDDSIIGNKINEIIVLRRDVTYGDETDYFDHPNVIGWVRHGDEAHAACAVLMSNGDAGYKDMMIGKKYAGRTYHNALRNEDSPITINNDGTGRFTVPPGDVAVWVID